MSYRDLREFMAQLEQGGELRRVREPVSPHLEMTAVADRVLRAGGPALLFESPPGTACRCWPTCSARRSGWRARWAWRT